MLTLLKKMAASAAVGMAVLTPAAVFADHWHGHFGFYFGVPLYAPYPYYYPPPYLPYPAPYYAYPPTPYAPQVYVDGGEAQSPAQPAQSAYWYYCPESKAYYPYVDQCQSPWQRLPIQPPGPVR